MAPLTWKNVDAPNVGAAGALMQGAQGSFGNAMDILMKTADRAGAVKQQQYSAKMLQGLAGVTDPNQVAAYLAQQDPNQITPETMAIAMQQPGVLLERQGIQVGLDDARGDLAHETNTRAGILAAAAQRMEAQRIADTTGDVGAAYDAYQGMNPYGLTAALDDTGAIGSKASNFQARRGTDYAYNEMVETDEMADFVRDEVSGKLIVEENSVEDARLRLFKDRDNYTPEQFAALNAGVASLNDANFKVSDANVTDVLQDNVDLGTDYQRTNYDIENINMAISNRIADNPLSLYQSNKSAFDALLTDGSPNDVTAALEKAGVASPGIGWDGVNQDIDNAIAALKEQGITVDRKEVAVAAMQTAETSGIPFVDSLKSGGLEATIDILRGANDEGRMRLANTELQTYERINQTFTETASKIEELRGRYIDQQSKGQTDRARETEAAIAKLVATARENTQAYYDRFGTAEAPAPAADALPATGAAVAPAAANLMGNAAPPGGAAMLAQMARTLQTQGTAPSARDYPFSPTFFDQQAMRTLGTPRTR